MAFTKSTLSLITSYVFCICLRPQESHIKYRYSGDCIHVLCVERQEGAYLRLVINLQMTETIQVPIAPSEDNVF